MFFLDYLEQLAFSAREYIRTESAQQKEIILFNKNDDWDTVYDSVPEFPHYDKYDYVQYAAIRSLRWTGDNVEITGVLKGDDYPNESVVTLAELSFEHCINLADYLAGLQPDYRQCADEAQQVFYLTVKITAASTLSPEETKAQFTSETGYLFSSTEAVHILDTEIIEAQTEIH